MKSNDMLIKIRERIKIYRDSPQVTVTYIDLAQTFEILSEIIEWNENIGFSKEKK